MPVLLSEREGPVLRLTLNRPEVRNAIDDEVIAALTAAGRSAAEDPELRAVVLAGHGKAFCAGADVAWMSKAIAYTREENRRDAEDLARVLPFRVLQPGGQAGEVLAVEQRKDALLGADRIGWFPARSSRQGTRRISHRRDAETQSEQ